MTLRTFARRSLHYGLYAVVVYALCFAVVASTPHPLVRFACGVVVLIDMVSRKSLEYLALHFARCAPKTGTLECRSLYLRSFKLDTHETRSLSLVPSKLEDRLLRHMTRVALPVKVWNPDKPVSPGAREQQPGSDRALGKENNLVVLDYTDVIATVHDIVSDEDAERDAWIPRVRKMALEAQLVAICIWNSDGVLKELIMLDEQEQLWRKTIIVLPAANAAYIEELENAKEQLKVLLRGQQSAGCGRTPGPLVKMVLDANPAISASGFVDHEGRPRWARRRAMCELTSGPYSSDWTWDRQLADTVRNYLEHTSREDQLPHGPFAFVIQWVVVLAVIWVAGDLRGGTAAADWLLAQANWLRASVAAALVLGVQFSVARERFWWFRAALVQRDLRPIVGIYLIHAVLLVVAVS